MRLFLTLLALILIPASLQAWGEDGHVIVSKIAESYLKPAAKLGIKDLLDERAISDPRICVWADLIRSGAIYDRKYPNHRTWHYINIELQEREEDYKPEEQKDHVVGAISQFIKIVKDPQETKENRKEALMFVIHFVGDMHQPLHCSNRNDDRGGNLQLVKSFRGKEEPRLNLHSVWDTSMVKADRGDLENEDYAKRLVAEIEEKQREAWSKGDAKIWAWENHLIGMQEVYLFSDGTLFPDRSEAPVELTDENYIKTKKPIVREQLKKAGVRLAWVLNHCFE